MADLGSSSSASTGHSEATPHEDVRTIDPSCTLALTQGGYYLLTGLWPLFSMRTFEAVTGSKHDRWLAKTVGVLVSVIGWVLLRGGLRRQLPSDLPLLASGSALGLAGIDMVYVARGRISPVYLLDAGVEVLLAVGWAWARGTIPALRHPR